MTGKNTSITPLRKKKAMNWVLVPFSILALYLLLETLTYLLLCINILRPNLASLTSKDFVATDMPYVRFDSISGYKYTGHLPRLVNVYDGGIVYDHAMPVNNRGYCSVYDYEFKKKSGCQRWMVFGDSYSAGEITDTTWVDLFQKRFDRDSVEFYNFSLEGAGIKGWYNIFFKEVVPYYDFDGIILPVFGDLRSTSYDFARDYIIKHSFTDYTGLNFFSSLPESSVSFDLEYKNQLLYESSVYSSMQIEAYKMKLTSAGKEPFQWLSIPFRFYFARYLSDAIRSIRLRPAFKKNYGTHNIDPKILSGAYSGSVDYNNLFGAENMQKVTEMLRYCRENGKKVYLISVPSFNVVVQDPDFYHNNIYNRHLKFLSEEYDCSYFDGYAYFDSIPPTQREKYTLRGDSHWNREGINLFVKMLPFKK